MFPSLGVPNAFMDEKQKKGLWFLLKWEKVVPPTFSKVRLIVLKKKFEDEFA